MKKNVLHILIAGIFLLTACTGTPSQASSTPSTESLSPTSSPLPTATQMLVATETPTASITHLPTIPTFTPTFDVSTIVTVTSAAKAECPKFNPDLTPDLGTFFSKNGLRVLMDEPVLDFLNHGGAPQKLITAFRQKYHWLDSNAAIQQDITGDGSTELILTDRYIVYIFGCKDKEYQTLLSYTDEPAWVQEIQFKLMEDMNLNGIPELIATEYGGHTYTSIRASIFEWNGQEFLPLIQGEHYSNNRYSTSADTSVPAHITVYDTDGNGTLEFVLESDLPIPVPALYSYMMPWRNEIDIYAWNGSHYILDRIEYSSPEFRFQAIQDADYEVIHGNLDKALATYQDTIANDKLESFSHEILVNRIMESSAIDGNMPTPTPVPPDITEYPRLAAYAYYRMMLLHIMQGHESDAGTVYKTLQQKFANDQHGRPYVEMATAFWEAYQSTHKMYDGCAASIQYAVEHPEILIPLGSDYHGSQSRTYVPADVCPFR
jgi:hypothetical protein